MDLITESTTIDFLQNKLQFPEWLKIDTDKIVVAGHSFGGLTANQVAFIDKRVKCCLTFDPWFFVI